MTPLDYPTSLYLFSLWGTSVPSLSSSHPRNNPSKMAAAVKLLFVLLSLCIFVTGRSQSCTLSNIQVQQTNTGGKNGYDPIFEVEVKNLCQCKLMNVSLWSEGFSSSMPIDPKLFRREGGGYLVNDGEGIPSLMAVKFQYAWDRAFKMSPAAFQVSCQKNRKELLMDTV